jgi:hypothetical protein
MTDSMVLALGLLVIGFYLIISNRLIALLHPLKMEFVARGEQLLNEPDLPADIAVDVKHSLDVAYSTSRAWLFVCLTPIAMVVAIYHQIVGRTDKSLDHVPVRLRNSVRIFGGVSVLLTIANSPLALCLFFIQIFAYAVLFLPVGTAVRELMRIGTVVEYSSPSALLHHYRSV